MRNNAKEILHFVAQLIPLLVALITTLIGNLTTQIVIVLGLLTYIIIRRSIQIMRFIKPLVIFILIYIVLSITSQYIVFNRLYVLPTLTLSLRIFSLTLAMLLLMELVIMKIIFMLPKIPKILIYTLLSLRVLEYLLIVMPELRHTILINYSSSVGKGFFGRIRLYTYLMRSLVLNATLRTIQVYESLLPRLSRLESF